MEIFNIDVESTHKKNEQDENQKEKKKKVYRSAHLVEFLGWSICTTSNQATNRSPARQFTLQPSPFEWQYYEKSKRMAVVGVAMVSGKSFILSDIDWNSIEFNRIPITK